MISTLFYPKELKDIIADLKAKDDLNEDALKSYRNAGLYQYWPVFAFLLYILGFFVRGYLIGAIIVLVALYILFRMFYKRLWVVNFKPYVFGYKSCAIVHKSTYSLNGDLTYHFEGEPDHKMHFTLIKALKYSNGEKVEYFVFGNYAVPINVDYMALFCLSKSRFVEFNNENQ